MALFKITQESREVIYRVFEVEADSEEDAIELIEDGEVDEEDSWIDVDSVTYTSEIIK